MASKVSFQGENVTLGQFGRNSAVKKQIIDTYDPVVLVGAGHATSEDLQKALTLAPICVAADGGAVLAQSAGADIHAVIGDFDSIPAQVMHAIPKTRQHQISEQDSTDFEKALARISAPVILGVGFAGGRVDHQLAVLHGMLLFAHQPCILLAGSEIILHAPPKLALETREEDVVSLFPLALVSGQSTGLRWPIDGIEFQPGRVIGTSNQAAGPCEITMNAPGMIVVLPARLLPSVMAEVGRPDAARWPSRA